MPNNNIRTRFAPSPTGYMHVGNLRTALYTYLMAKHDDGTFILRIEDTDQGRYVEGAVDVIYNTLRETGLLWDEGPDIGGPVGPYVQSERMGMFQPKAWYSRLYFGVEDRYSLPRMTWVMPMRWSSTTFAKL